MVREGYWSWPGGGRYEGVPLSNFAGWLATGGGRLRALGGDRRGDDPTPGGALRTATARSRSTRGRWVGETVANLVFWRRPRVAAAGGGRDGRVRGPGRGAAAAGAPGPPCAMAARAAVVRVVVVGAGVGGLAAAVRLAAAGHARHGARAGRRAGRQGRAAGARPPAGVYRFDTGPSLLTMPWVLRDLFAQTGAPPARRASSSCASSRSRATASPTAAPSTLSADLPRAMRGARGVVAGRGRRLGALPRHVRGDVARVRAVPHRPAAVAAATCARPPRRPTRATCCACARGRRCATLARAHVRDPRLRMVIERFATYAGRRPAARAGGAGGRRLRRARLRRLARARRAATGIVEALVAAPRRRSAGTCASRPVRWRSSGQADAPPVSARRQARSRPTPSCGTATRSRSSASCAAARRRRRARRALALRPRADARRCAVAPTTSSTTRSAFPPTTTPSSTTSSPRAGRCATRRSTSARRA